MPMVPLRSHSIRQPRAPSAPTSTKKPAEGEHSSLLDADADAEADANAPVDAQAHSGGLTLVLFRGPRRHCESTLRIFQVDWMGPS